MASPGQEGHTLDQSVHGLDLKDSHLTVEMSSGRHTALKPYKKRALL